MMPELNVMALWFSVAMVFANAARIAVDYIGALFGKAYEENNVKRKVVTLLVAILSFGVCWMSIYATFLPEMGIAALTQIIAYILTAVTFGMQTFYVWL